MTRAEYASHRTTIANADLRISHCLIAISTRQSKNHQAYQHADTLLQAIHQPYRRIRR